MDERRICFILCISSELYKEECQTYLQALEVPEGYTTDVITVEGEESVCAAYNAAMRASDAKYKIYLRQEVFIRYRKFLTELLKIFADPTIGMIGLKEAEWPTDSEARQKGVCDVTAVDGRLIATQIDIPWREELFAGWDYYDLSQALEFQKAGYRVVVPAPDWDEWYLYDGATQRAPVKKEDYQTFLSEYGKQLYGNEGLKKRILYPTEQMPSAWNIPYALTALGMEAVPIAFCGIPEMKTQRDIDDLSGQMRKYHVDAVMTHDYYAPVAVACAENDIPYIAWIYDAIQIALYDDSIRFPTNYIFDFDRMQAQETRERGAVYVRHMPLAANVRRMDGLVISPADERHFACDISFVGSFYTDPDFQLPMEQLTEQTAAEVRQILANGFGKWDGAVRFCDRLSDGAIAELSRTLAENIYDRKLIGDKRYIEETFFSRGISCQERREMLRRLGRHEWDVRLYTREKESGRDLPGIQVEGGLDYEQELPKAYYFSRINLNLTLPSIRSGVPLRVFDILAAGGFLLTNYQPELEELFVAGQELEVFHSFEEMEDKANYYLHHEKERLQIALNGHRKVREHYTYEKMLGKILDMVSEDLRQKGRSGLR